MSNASSRLTNALLGAVLALVVIHAVPRAHAESQSTVSQDYLAVTAPGTGVGNNVLFVIDPKTERLLVYEHRAGAKLELVTVRDMEFDRAWIQWPKEGPKATTPGVLEMKPK